MNSITQVIGVVKDAELVKVTSSGALVGADGLPLPIGYAIGQLARWKKKLATSPSTAVIVLNGDSTTDYTTSASTLTNSLRAFHTLPGQSLYGMVGDASHIIPLGYNGMSLSAWLADLTKLAALVSSAPDLVIASWGLNDVRLGQVSLSQMVAMLEQYVLAVSAALPDADILLRMPNSMLTTDVGSLHYVQKPAGTNNPTGAAQEFTTLLRNAYLAMLGKYGHVDVLDVQTLVFGSECRSSHPLMADQLHPTTADATVNGVPVGGGYVEIARAIATRIGIGNNSFVFSPAQYQTAVDSFYSASAGTGYIDISSMDVFGSVASQFPLSNADVLFIDGFDAPISLASATIYRPFGGNNIRIGGLGAVDYSAAVGRRVFVGANHPPATTKDRQIVSVNLPSIAAGATTAVTVTVTAASTGDAHDATAVVCSPSASFVAAGLRLLNCYPNGSNTVALIVNNPTAGAVDLAAANFAFWVVR